MKNSSRMTALALLVGLTASACGDDKGNDDTTTNATTSGPTTATTTNETTPTTTGNETTEPGTTVEPTTVEPTTVEPTTVEPTTSGTTTDDPSTGGVDGPLCADLGGYDAVGELLTSFVGKVLVDERINAYFLTTEVDGANLTQCLTKQVGNATGCAGVVYDCKDMKAAHAGMGISMNDFANLAEDFSIAMDEHQTKYATLTDDDKMAILGVLGSMAPDIVEDDTNDATVYQRIGRKPGILTVIGDGKDPKAFIGIVAADVSINGFFGMTDIPRLETCLVRQVTTATGGPAIYGKEVDAPPPVDPGVAAANPCRDMVSSHKALKDAKDMKGIEFADFGALVGDLVKAMNNFKVPMAEQMAILGALGPLCKDIVTVDPNKCM